MCLRSSNRRLSRFEDCTTSSYLTFSCRSFPQPRRSLFIRIAYPQLSPTTYNPEFLACSLCSLAHLHFNSSSPDSTASRLFAIHSHLRKVDGITARVRVYVRYLCVCTQVCFVQHRNMQYNSEITVAVASKCSVGKTVVPDWT